MDVLKLATKKDPKVRIINKEKLPLITNDMTQTCKYAKVAIYCWL